MVRIDNAQKLVDMFLDQTKHITKIGVIIEPDKDLVEYNDFYVEYRQDGEMKVIAL